MPTKKSIACPLCKRDINTGHPQKKEGLLYCYGCNFEFSAKQDLTGTIEEIPIPKGVDSVRLRLVQNSLEIKVSWFRCFNYWRFLRHQGRHGLIAVIPLLFNKTTITANRHLLLIDHKPVDYLPPVRYERHYIKQFYVKELVYYSTFFLTETTHGLYAKVSTGEEKLLLWNLKESTLLFLEQEIERVMGIKNKPVQQSIEY